MAGITNYPFRALCRRFGAGLFVSEMILAGPLVRGDAHSRRLADFGADEAPRSLQLYGVDPATVGEAVRFLVGEGRVDHVDLNFGCPVRKATRKGGGAAIPVKHNLLRALPRPRPRPRQGAPLPPVRRDPAALREYSFDAALRKPGRCRRTSTAASQSWVWRGT